MSNEELATLFVNLAAAERGIDRHFAARKLAAALTAADKRVEEAYELLGEFVDADPCEWDHNHSCQAHGFFYITQGERCPNEEAKQLIRALKGDEK